MSKELKCHGFTFVGTTICYAFMQAVGMVNDHIIECFRWQEVQLPAQLPESATLLFMPNPCRFCNTSCSK